MPEGTGGFGAAGSAQAGLPGCFPGFCFRKPLKFHGVCRFFLSGFLCVCSKSWFMAAISSSSEEGAADAREGLGRGLPWLEGLSGAMGARGQAGPGYAHASHFSSLQEGYFQPLRSTGEATLRKKSNTTKAPLKSSSPSCNPRRSLNCAEFASVQHRPAADAWRFPGHNRSRDGDSPHVPTHRASSQLGEPSQPLSIVPKSPQSLTAGISLPQECKSTK